MDAMGLSNRKPNTVSTSHSGSFTPNNPDLAKAAGIVSVPRLPRPALLPRALGAPFLLRPGLISSHRPTVRVLTLGTGLGVETVLHGQAPQSEHWDALFPKPLAFSAWPFVYLAVTLCSLCVPVLTEYLLSVVCWKRLLCGHLLSNLKSLAAPLYVRLWASTVCQDLGCCVDMYFVNTYCEPSPEFS